MLRFDARHPLTLCDGVTRRDFLHAGALAGLGLTLPNWFACKAAGAVRSRQDINCIFLFLVGGPSQHDTWDPKPNSPPEIRGPFKPIATNVAGVRITDLFPQTAQHADKFSIVRSVTFQAEPQHHLGLAMMQSGRIGSVVAEHPHLGCVVSYLTRRQSEMPTHLLLPRPVKRPNLLQQNGQTPGYLGTKHAPFVLNADPADPQFKVPGLLPPDYISAARLDRRQKMRETVDGALMAFEKHELSRQYDDHFRLAYRLMSSPRARKAFDLEKESASVRDRYGRTRFGQGCLLARRLVENGVRFVTLNMFESETPTDGISWDTHGSRPFCNIQEWSRLVVPDFDKGYSALLEDLHERGLLETTLVVALGEFGRTPIINNQGGRDHYTGVFSILLGGGPVKCGRVVGESDEHGWNPKARPVTPMEVMATIYHALGLDIHHELPGPQNRPIPLVDYGVEPIAELF